LKLREDTEEHIARLSAKHEQPAEDLKAKARRLSREYAKQIQAQADRAATRWLDAEKLTP
jgi:hypothetical protein